MSSWIRILRKPEHEYAQMHELPQRSHGPSSSNDRHRRSTSYNLSSRFFEIIPWSAWFLTLVILALALAMMKLYQSLGNLGPNQQIGWQVTLTALTLFLGFSFLVSELESCASNGMVINRKHLA